ncbi:ATP synthase subunit s, mitochondrial [Sergentomyia squamirostris]
MLTGRIHSLLTLQQKQIQGRQLWEWINIIFNTVDKRRLRKVGPDRLCAEWVLKNGGAVRFWQNPNNLLSNYNLLPPEKETPGQETLKEIDATNSAIMTIGFAHLAGCHKIDKIIIDNCKMVGDRGFQHFANVKNSLNHLEIAQCANVTDSGIRKLIDLTNLKTLTLKQLPGVKDWSSLEKELKMHLKNCHIKIT